MVCPRQIYAPGIQQEPLREPRGSLRDVQDLAGHASLAMIQRYIEGDTDAKRKLVALIEHRHVGITGGKKPRLWWSRG